MYFLPKSDEVVVVCQCGAQDLFHCGPLCVAGPNGIIPVRERDVAIRQKIHNHHGVFMLPVNMSGRVIV
jgi:hypothetical protein